MKMNPSYEAYLASDHWKALRARYKKEKIWECAVCGKTKRLHLHHRTYARVGKERLSDLIPLCGDHHKATHRLVSCGVPLLDAHLKVGKKERRKKQEPGHQSQPALVLTCQGCGEKFPRNHTKLRCHCGCYLVLPKKSDLEILEEKHGKGKKLKRNPLDYRLLRKRSVRV